MQMEEPGKTFFNWRNRGKPNAAMGQNLARLALHFQNPVSADPLLDIDLGRIINLQIVFVLRKSNDRKIIFGLPVRKQKIQVG